LPLLEDANCDERYENQGQDADDDNGCEGAPREPGNGLLRSLRVRLAFVEVGLEGARIVGVGDGVSEGHFGSLFRRAC